MTPVHTTAESLAARLWRGRSHPLKEFIILRPLYLRRRMLTDNCAPACHLGGFLHRAHIFINNILGVILFLWFWRHRMQLTSTVAARQTSDLIILFVSGNKIETEMHWDQSDMLTTTALTCICTQFTQHEQQREANSRANTTMEPPICQSAQRQAAVSCVVMVMPPDDTINWLGKKKRSSLPPEPHALLALPFLIPRLRRRLRFGSV